MSIDLGKTIRDARRAAGLTSTELAIAVGKDASQVSRWENNVHRPTGESVERLIEVLGLDAAEVYRALAAPAVERVPMTVPEAIRADQTLCPEAKVKLLGLYLLLQRVGGGEVRPPVRRLRSSA